MASLTQDPTRHAFTLSERDIAVLSALSLLEYRFLSAWHIARLFFDGDESGCRARLDELASAGLVVELHIFVIKKGQPSEPIYTLGKPGGIFLSSERCLPVSHLYTAWKPGKSQFLEHELRVADFRTAVTLLTKERENLELLFWDNEPAIKADRDRYLKRQPRSAFPIADGYFAVLTPQGTDYFYLELDRATMTNAAMETKFSRYVRFFQIGIHRSWMRIPSFRVLVVVPSRARERELMGIVRGLPHCRGMFWFATYKEQGTRSSITERELADPIWWNTNSSTPKELWPNPRPALPQESRR